MYRIRKDNNFVFNFGTNEYEKLSEDKISIIDNIIQEKEKEIENLKYTLDIFKREKVSVVKNEVEYIWFNHKNVEDIRKWLEITKTKYDKRKKYEEKDAVDFTERMLSRFIFGNREVKIYNASYLGLEHYGTIIDIFCEGMNFEVIIPNFNNINVNNIKDAYNGMVAIFVRTSDCSWDLIAIDYDEEHINYDIEKFFEDKERIEELKEKTKEFKN